MAAIVPILRALKDFYNVELPPPRHQQKLRMLWDAQGRGPFQVLIGTVLSQRTRDERTALAARALFARYPTAKALARAPLSELRRLVKPANFYKTKARRIRAIARLLEPRGRVPPSLPELLAIPGVGRKTANCVLVYGFQKPAIPVDTHVHRISNRLGLVATRTPEQTERALERITPRQYWLWVNDLMVRHGRALCRPIGPRCGECPVRKQCAYFEKVYRGSTSHRDVSVMSISRPP